MGCLAGLLTNKASSKLDKRWAKPNSLSFLEGLLTLEPKHFNILLPNSRHRFSFLRDYELLFNLYCRLILNTFTTKRIFLTHSILYMTLPRKQHDLDKNHFWVSQTITPIQYSIQIISNIVRAVIGLLSTPIDSQ